MLTEAEQAHLEGAKNLYRYNRSDIFNIAVWVGFFALTAAITWGLAHGVALFPHHQPAPIHYGHLRLHADFAPYKPLYTKP